MHVRLSISDEPLVAFAAALLHHLHPSVNEAPLRFLSCSFILKVAKSATRLFLQEIGIWKKKKGIMTKKKKEKTLADTIT